MSEKPLVYLETSFISHLTARPSRDPLHAAKQQSSRRWWGTCREQFTLVVSPTVYEECREGEAAMAGKRLGLIEENAFLFPQNPAILELAKRFLVPAGPLPSKAEADALHIASAGAYGCEFLLTWNFKHIANAIIKRRVERICTNMATNRLPSAPRTNSSENGPKDTIVEELHRHRAELAARFDYDLERLYEYYASVPISPRMRRMERQPVEPKRVPRPVGE